MLAVSSPPVSPDDEHAPRLYIVKRDGSGGVELLRQRDVTNYLTDAENDPDCVLLTERLPDCSDVACITVLHRASHNPSETWLCPYAHETVVPPGLQVNTSSMARRKVGRMDHWGRHAKIVVGVRGGKSGLYVYVRVSSFQYSVANQTKLCGAVVPAKNCPGGEPRHILSTQIHNTCVQIHLRSQFVCLLSSKQNKPTGIKISYNIAQKMPNTARRRLLRLGSDSCRPKYVAVFLRVLPVKIVT